MTGKITFLSFVVFFMFIHTAFGIVKPPTNVELTAGLDFLTVTWSGDISTDDGYYVYWGTTSSNLSRRITISDKTIHTYTITGLDAGTTYYVALSSYDNDLESGLTPVESITTMVDTTMPAVPSGLAVSGNVSETSVTLTWAANIEDDIDSYQVYYGTNSESLDSSKEVDASIAHQTTIDGLTASTRYYFVVSAINTKGNESDNSAAIIVDTLVDNLPPDVPESVKAVVSETDEISVTIVPGNNQMHDFAGVKLYYGAASEVYDTIVDLGMETSYVLTGLELNTTWYFAASAYDTSGNESALTIEVSVQVEDTLRFLNQPDEFDGGCFISTAGRTSHSYMRILLLCVMASILSQQIIQILKPFIGISHADIIDDLGHNVIGVSVGYYIPSVSQFNKFYGDDNSTI